MQKFQTVFWKKDEAWIDKNSTKLVYDKYFS